MTKKGKTKRNNKSSSGTKSKPGTTGREISWMTALTIGSWPIILSLLFILLTKPSEPSPLDVQRLFSLPIAIFLIEVAIFSTGRVRSVGGAFLASLIAAVLGWFSFLFVVANTIIKKRGKTYTLPTITTVSECISFTLEASVVHRTPRLVRLLDVLRSLCKVTPQYPKR